jgi:hypothetical protein
MTSRLTDTQILHIFLETVVREASKLPSDQNQFLSAYADAVRMAEKEDFLLLRPASLILIAKYKLGYLLRDRELVLHNFPSRQGKTA